MDATARDRYLAAEVLTAAPQKLQLMLIEGAIRFVDRARRLWGEQKHDEASESLVRAQEILGEMLASLDRQAQPDLVPRVGAVYLFVFRCLMEANFDRDPRKLDDAIRVLEEERKTWRLVCERLGGRHPSEATSPTDAPAAAPIDASALDGPTGEAACGFSIDA
jgi:flagellar secretion chaperone FliS